MTRNRQQQRRPFSAQYSSWILWALAGFSCVFSAIATDDSPSSATHVIVPTEFLEACTQGNIDKVKEFLTENPSWSNGSSPDGETCLHVAGIYGQTEVTRSLLQEYKADPNVRSTHDQGLRMHPLSWNVYAGNVDTAKVLLEHGALVNLDIDAPPNSPDKIITSLDIVTTILATETEGEEKPAMEPFRQMKTLLEAYDAKSYKDLIEQQRSEGDQSSHEL